MTDLPIGTVTLLLTDVEGSVHLWETSPSEMRSALARHDALVGDYVSSHNGMLVKAKGEGDSCFCVFARASDALSAALSLQLALRTEPWPTPSPLRVRIALHTGEADLRDGDYHGAAVNRCARLRAIAHGGQVLLSHATYDLVRDALPEGVSLKDLGEQRLRDLARPEQVLQLCHPELPADFPRLRSLDSYPTNLPLQLTSFVGRQREMAEVRQILGAVRLVTLTGAGGCGKTRLALQLAADLLDEYPDGVWLAELAPLASLDLVPQTVALALGLREQVGQPILSTLIGYLSGRSLLLVLDNCEHLIDGCASLVDTLLHACPRLRVLATSRESLGISGETSYRVPSLALPDAEHLPPLERLTQYEAMRLFIDRALAVQPSFAVTNQNAPSVAQVCWRLDGIPLAIELAAARIRLLSPEQISARLDQCFKLLTGGSRTALPRHQTLRATIDWSYSLLSEPERALLGQLVVFAGGWTLEAAEAICCGEGIESEDVLDLLSRLVDKSLVLVETGPSGQSRYRLLETVRQYAWDRLLESGCGPAARNRHAAYFREQVEQSDTLGVAAMMIPPPAWLTREQDNLRTALRWLADSGDLARALRLGAALGLSQSGNSYLIDLRRRAAELVALPGAEAHPAERAWAGLGLAILMTRQGQNGPAEEFCQESLAVFRQLGDSFGEAWALALLAEVVFMRADFPTALAYVAESEMVCDRIDGGFGSSSLTSLRFLHRFTRGYFALFYQHDAALCRARVEPLLAELHQLGLRGSSYIHYILGIAAIAERRWSAAGEYLREALLVGREGGDLANAAGVLEALAGLASAVGQFERSARLGGASASLRDLIGAPLPGVEQRRMRERQLAPARAALGEETFSRAFAEGQAMTLEQAVEYALQDEAEM